MGTIIMILIGIPIAIALFSILRTKVDPDYKERMDNATKVRKELSKRGLNSSMINDEVRRRDYIFKNEQKDKKFVESITKNLSEEDSDIAEAINNGEIRVHRKGTDAYNQNIENAKEIVRMLTQEELNRAETSSDYLAIAESTSEEADDSLNDKQWGEEIYKMALDKANSPEEYRNIAQSVQSEQYLNNKEWADEIYRLSETN